MTINTFLFVLVCFVTFITVSGSALKLNDNDSVTKISDDAETTSQKNVSISHLALNPEIKIRLPFAGSGCKCQNKRCSCCASIYFQPLDYDRQACAVLTYDPSEMVNFEVIVNQTNMYNATTRMSTFTNRENKEYCVPILPFTLIGPIDFCVRLFGITIVENKLHICMNMMTRVAENPVFQLKMNCMDMDVDPPNRIPEGAITSTTTKPMQVDDVYDPVNTEAVNKV